MIWDTLAAFDLETTGVDVEQDRIVTAALVVTAGGHSTATYQWLADPGIDIPTAASDIHGVTTARARAEGRPAREVAEQVSAQLADEARRGIPLVVMNAPYDLTLLDRELERHRLPSLAEQCAGAPLYVLDPRVLDKRVDPYRRGRRTLTDLAGHYGVQLTDAHTAAADALAAAHVTAAIAERHPNVQSWPLQRLHDLQVEWAHAQAVDLQAYLSRKDPQAVVETAWPMIPRQRGAQ